MNDFVAVAGSFYQPIFVQKGHISPSLGNHSRFLRYPCGDAHAWPAGSKHLAQELLSKRHGFTSDSVVTQ
jgi:hypothetical protein